MPKRRLSVNYSCTASYERASTREKSHLKFSHPIHGFITIHWIRYITSPRKLSHLDIRLTRGSMSYTRALSFWRHCLILSDSAGTFFVFHLAYCLPVNKKNTAPSYLQPKCSFAENAYLLYFVCRNILLFAVYVNFIG